MELAEAPWGDSTHPIRVTEWAGQRLKARATTAWLLAHFSPAEPCSGL